MPTPSGFLHLNILDYDGTVQDLTFAWLSEETSPGDTSDWSLNKASWTRNGENYLTLRFTLREYLLLPELEILGYHIGERMEVWAGAQDETGAWVDDEDLWAGYIRAFDVEPVAGEIIVRLTLDSYNLLLAKPIQSFPDPNVLTRMYHSPPNSTLDTAIDGASIGYTPKDYIVGLSYAHGGTKAFDGIVRQALGGNTSTAGHTPLDLDGVPDIPWALVTFDASGRPGNSSILGHSEVTSVEMLVQEVLDLAAVLLMSRNDGKGVLPAFYVKTIIDPDDNHRLKGRFTVVDLNDKSTVTKVFTDLDVTPEGEYGIWGSFRQSCDGTQAYDSVTVIGAGAQLADFDPTTHERRYTRIMASNTTNRGYYSNRMSTTPGFELQIYSDTITTIEQASQLANYVAANALGGRRSCSFNSYDPVEEGDVIRVKSRATQGLATDGQVYIVKRSRRHGILPQWSVEAGDPRPTLQDIMNGPLARLFSLGLVLNPRGRGLPNFTNPAVPKGHPVQTVTSNRFENGLQSADTAVSALKQLPATALTKANAEGQLIGSNRAEVVGGDTIEIVNYVDTQQNETLQRPVLCNDFSDIDHPKYATVLPAPQRFTVRPDGSMDDWDFADGRNGPQHHTYTFQEDTWEAIVMVGTIYLCTAKALRVLDDTTGALLAPIYGDGVTSPPTVTIADVAPSLAVSLKIADPVAGGAYVLVDPPVDGQHPLRLVQPHDGAQVHVAGVPSGARVEVLVSEEGLLYAFFLPCEERYCPVDGCNPAP